jgi:hypothetical protein
VKPFPAIRKAWAATTVVVALSLGASHEAHATLGGDLGSIAADEHVLTATRAVQKLASGERHDLALPSGTIVHEYVSNGVVFAITWQGPAVPDLQTLLGAYFAQLASHVASGSHHSMRFVGNDFVMRSMGHGRSHSGRAWVPSLVPSGLNIDSLE